MTQQRPSAWEELRAGWQALRDRAREEIAACRNQRHVTRLRQALRRKVEQPDVASDAGGGGGAS